MVPAPWARRRAHPAYGGRAFDHRVRRSANGKTFALILRPVSRRSTQPRTSLAAGSASASFARASKLSAGRSRSRLRPGRERRSRFACRGDQQPSRHARSASSPERLSTCGTQNEQGADAVDAALLTNCIAGAGEMLDGVKCRPELPSAKLRQRAGQQSRRVLTTADGVHRAAQRDSLRSLTRRQVRVAGQVGTSRMVARGNKPG